ncbi:MAG: hypothetical protein IKO80_01415 [Lachnospiraceae bacterium]|nr:hypothetical protein [Lachnospiraceae bacterium]
MKKRGRLIPAVLLMCLVVCGCGAEGNAVSGKPQAAAGVQTVADVFDAAMQDEETAEAEPVAVPEPGAVTGTADAVSADVDLTEYSSTMVYSEVYNMMTVPDEYIGKSIKMAGQCSVYLDEATGKTYYACIIQDATACCSQGMEFELSPEYAYPADGSEICVVGTFDTYVEGEYTYCTLRDARLV